MGKEINMTKVRDSIMTDLVNFMKSQYETDVEYVGSGVVMMPITDPEGNESYATIQVAIPRGKRIPGGYEPYNGYEAAKAWKVDCETKALEAQIKAQNKAQKDAEKARKAAARTKKVKVEDFEKMKKEIRDNIKGA